MPASSRSPTQWGAPANCQSHPPAAALGDARSPSQQCGRAGHEALSLLSPLPTIRLAPAPSWPTTAALQAALGIHFSLQHRLEGELQPTQALTLKPKDSSQSAALLILFHQNLQHFLLSYPPPLQRCWLNSSISLLAESSAALTAGSVQAALQGQE